MKDIKLWIYDETGAYTSYREDSIISLKISRSMFKDGPAVGCCVSGKLEAVLYIPSESIIRNAKIIPFVRNAGGSWVQKSTFFVYTRQIDHITGVVSIIAYDAIYKAEAPMITSGEVGSWPRSDVACMQEIASRTGAAIDSSSIASMDRGYMIQFPGSVVADENGTVDRRQDGVTTMREIAGYVASMYAANWVIDNAGNWRLIFLGDIPPYQLEDLLVDELGNAIVIGGVRILV